MALSRPRFCGWQEKGSEALAWLQLEDYTCCVLSLMSICGSETQELLMNWGRLGKTENGF